MKKRRIGYKIFGEYFREASVLILVFGILEDYKNNSNSNPVSESGFFSSPFLGHFLWDFSVLFISVVCLFAGWYFESKRPPKEEEE